MSLNLADICIYNIVVVNPQEGQHGVRVMYECNNHIVSHWNYCYLLLYVDISNRKQLKELMASLDEWLSLCAGAIPYSMVCKNIA